MAQALQTGAEQVRWDLTELYSSPLDPRIEQSLAEALDASQEFESTYRGRIASLSPDEFAEMMATLEAMAERTALSGTYAGLLHTLNTADPAAGRLLARVEEAGSERGRHTVFFSLELADLTDEQVAPLHDHPRASQYRHTVEEARKYRRHNLTEVEEKLLNEFSPVGGSAWVRLHEELTSSIKVDLDGETIGLEIALAKIRDPAREVRKGATLAVTAALRKDIRTRAYVFNVLLQEKSISDRLRGYDTWISSRNLANETSDEAVDALVSAVTSRYDIVAMNYTSGIAMRP